MSEHLHVAPLPHIHEDACLAGEFVPAFPADEENLLLDLLDELESGRLAPRPSITAGEVEALEERYGFRVVWQRLGVNAPNSGYAGYAAVVCAFGERYGGLPVSYARYEHAHAGHDHEGHDCGKIHGPLRRRLDRLEEKVLGKLGGKHSRAMAAAAFRLGALTFCPGDDILAVGAQAYGAVSGHMDSHGGQHEEVAVLPKRPRLDFELEEGTKKAKVSVPLDVPVAHGELPATGIGDVLRERLANDGPRQVAARNERLAKEAETRPERRRRRRRIVALGTLALAALGIGASDTVHQASIPKPVALAPPSPPQAGLHPGYAAAEIPLTQPVKIKKGDSQWEIVHERIAKTLRRSDVPLVNITTAYTAALNAKSYPNPNAIVPGQTLQVPSPATLERFVGAMNHPKEAPGLARALRQLNMQARYADADSRQIVGRIAVTLRASQEK